MPSRLLKTVAEYEAAVRRAEELMGAAPGSDEADELEFWAHLVSHYEDEHFPIPPPEPIDAIRFRIEQQGLSPADLVPILGSRSRVSEILNRRRPLSLGMIRRLHSDLGIPAGVLLQECRLEQP